MNSFCEGHFLIHDNLLSFMYITMTFKVYYLQHLVFTNRNINLLLLYTVTVLLMIAVWEIIDH